ncbi:MAG: DEAD/DEAH box helicase [Myxococcales bacterium]|nr:DEAD/DEAH box helicase [Myxococcales bacterium]MCB9652171.1 DEAD/DEAH box helicase [Deltaproteobacteria bacterium]
MSDAFDAVHPALRAALERKGFNALTTVQQAVLEADATAHNLRISSQTGSGKTVALGLALADDLISAVEARTPGPVVVVVAPTRELAAQVEGELAWLFADVRGFDTTVVTGGTDLVRERRLLSRRAPLLVATPGRLLDHVRNGAVDLARVRHVVLDEADQMLDMGFRDDLDALVDALPEERRSHLVSATFPEQVARFADRFQPGAVHVQGTVLGQANQDITHVAHVVHISDRYPALVNCMLAMDEARCLVFVARRVDAADLAEALAEDGFSALPFSGDMSQPQRTRTLNAFRNGIVKTLVATDVAARGIDVADIRTVIHFDLPIDADTYTHRSGRTGRAGQTGRSILIVPTHKERRVRWLLGGARVEADWCRVPSAKKIEKANNKRTRRALHALLEAAPELDEGERAYATELLERHDPNTLVAVLMRMAQHDLPRAPMNVRTYEPRTDVRHDKDDARKHPPGRRPVGRRPAGRQRRHQGGAHGRR